jgi:transcriptional regulator with XRE-family HTH domain
VSIPLGENSKNIFAERISELIGGSTVTSFARKVKLNQAAVDRYVKGLREPNADALRTIAKSCEVTTDWLLGISDNPIGVSDTDWRSRALYAEQKLARVSKALGHALKGFEELQEAVR